MMFDNLFATLGGVTTALVLLGILAVVGTPAVRAVAWPMSSLRRLQPRGR